MINLETIIKINKIIERDTLESSYKLALLKSLIMVIKKYDHFIHYENGFVKVPFYFIVEEWFFYYLPFVYLDIRQHKSKNLVLNSEIENLYKEIFKKYKYHNEDWKYIYSLIYKDYYNFNLDVSKIFRKLRNLIINNPMKYVGTDEYELFPKEKIEKVKKVDRKNFEDFGFFEIEKNIYNIFKYLGDNFYGINTIINRWEELLGKLNKFELIKSVKEILVYSIKNEIRDTKEIRELFKGKKVYCVWSGKRISSFDIDHILPFSVFFNNDYWNLLPTNPKINNKKRNKIPSPELIKNTKDRILEYWEIYNNSFKYIFKDQIKISLGSRDFENSLNQLINKSNFLINQLGYQEFNLKEIY